MPEVPDLPTDVARVVQSLTMLYGSSFTMLDIIRYLEAIRQKDVRLHVEDLPPGISGYCVALRDVDYIAIRQGLDPQRTLIATLHELAHLLLGHVASQQDTHTRSYAEFLHLRHDTDRACQRAVAHAGYATTQELAAETLATIMAAGIYRQDAETPPLARLVYGDAT